MLDHLLEESEQRDSSRHYADNVAFFLSLKKQPVSDPNENDEISLKEVRRLLQEKRTSSD